MSLSRQEVQTVAARMLADYDAGHPCDLFAERGSGWLTLEDAYAVQQAVADLRRARGEQSIGYKVGCVSAAIQRQFGIHQPVRGCVWRSEWRTSGCHLRPAQYANLAVEGEIALRLSRDIPAEFSDERGSDEHLVDCIECWAPVIEMHNYVFRGNAPTVQELVAGNALHAGCVAPPAWTSPSTLAPEAMEIRIEIDGALVETARCQALPGGWLRSLRWLASALSLDGQRLKSGNVVLTGSPGQLVPVAAARRVTVLCGAQRTELFLGVGR